jgi:hypothetical protein
VTHETLVYGLGELHLRVLMERVREHYKFEVQTHPPRVAYRETVSAAAEGHYRHKKQSGGAGQFGEVHLRVEPLARGAGFEFVDAVKGGTIPGQFMPAVEKGVRQALDTGVVARAGQCHQLTGAGLGHRGRRGAIGRAFRLSDAPERHHQRSRSLYAGALSLRTRAAQYTGAADGGTPRRRGGVVSPLIRNVMQ